jgi:hypothetical protein
MQEMREGAAWAEGLAMEGDSLALATAGAGLVSPGGTSRATQYAAPQAISAQAGAPPSDACLQGLQALSAMSQRSQRQRMADNEAAAADLLPGVRALLMHPGGGAGGAFMVPLEGPAAACREPGAPPSCAASLAASRALPDGCNSWPPLPPHFYGTQPPPQQQQSASSFYAMPLAAPAPQPQAPSPFHLYQTAPAAFAPPTTAAQSLGLAGPRGPPLSAFAPAPVGYLVCVCVL